MQHRTGPTDPGGPGKARMAGQALLVTTVTVAALSCQGTDGPVLTSLSDDTSSGGGAATMAGSAGTTSTAGNAGSVAVPQPAPMVTWQIQLEGPVDTSVDAELYIIDLDAPPPTFDELEAAGRTVVCFFSAGSLEPWRTDADALPPGAVGEPLADYPEERWLDIRDPAVATVMADRIDLAAARGCDGVLPANIDGFLLATGFPLTLDDQLDFNRLLSAAAHQAGLSIGLAGGDTALAEALVTDYDWAFAVNCVASGCSHFASFMAASQPVFVVEYGDAGLTDTICPRASELGLNAIVKSPELDAARVACP